MNGCVFSEVPHIYPKKEKVQNKNDEVFPRLSSPQFVSVDF